MNLTASDSGTFFKDNFNLGARDYETLLGEALARGGDFADLYFEYSVTEKIEVEEGLVKTAERSVLQGVGVRVISGDRTGYGYSDILESPRMRAAAAVASAIANSPPQPALKLQFARPPTGHNLYPIRTPIAIVELAPKVDLLRRADGAARSCDPRVLEVRVTLQDEIRIVLIVNSEGLLVSDYRPLVRFNAACIAQEGSERQLGLYGGGGRVGLEFFDERTPESYAREAARQALLQLDARAAPAGVMDVILGPGWPGILLHEAIGHGLESDFNRKGISAFSGMLGQRVASSTCTVIDDGTLPKRRGSLNVDDEGTPTRRTVLIEKGILKGFMQDRLSATLTGAELTGNGRRQTYAHVPMPRMTNTFLLQGESDPEEILSSVQNGLYAVHFGGGQVDITSGKFVFSASEAYLIEQGKVTAPVKGATLVGNGPEVLTKVAAVAHNLRFDEGIGTCGKDGQMIPVGVGMPMVRLNAMTVGGTKV